LQLTTVRDLHPLHLYPTRRSSDLTSPTNPTAVTCTTKSLRVACNGLGAPFIWVQITRFNRMLELVPVPSGSILPLIIMSGFFLRSEEHTSELQSRENLVCRLLLEK